MGSLKAVSYDVKERRHCGRHLLIHGYEFVVHTQISVLDSSRLRNRDDGGCGPLIPKLGNAWEAQ